MTEQLLEIQGISVSFGGVRALQDVNLTVAEGATVGLIGSNGAGKTTLFNSITGFLRPDAGSVRFAGSELSGIRPYEIARRGLLRTFQRARPLAGLTVLENVMAGAFRQGSSGVLETLLGSRRARREEAAVRTHALALMDRVGLHTVAYALPAELSAGQLRLLEIARALAAEPQMLLLDEPMAGLNREETEAVAGIIEELSSSGISCLLVEHDVEMVFRVCDRITVLYYGQVIAEGTPADIRQEPAVIESYLGRRNESAHEEADRV